LALLLNAIGGVEGATILRRWLEDASEGAREDDPLATFGQRSRAPSRREISFVAGISTAFARVIHRFSTIDGVAGRARRVLTLPKVPRTLTG
jgi:hypothetical protein